MNFYIISYDLKVPGRDYAPLYSAIRELGEWQHPLESTWVVVTDRDENYIYDKLRETMDSNDLLLIFRIVPESRQGWLARSFWEWLQTKSARI